MPAPVALAAALAKKILWRRVRRVAYVVLPLVGSGLLAVIVFTSLLGASSEQSEMPSSGACPGAELSGKDVPGLTGEQTRNARTIVAVGRDLKVPSYGWVIAVATAMQESSLVNIPHGDRDSVGLFQQRAAWGSTPERMDPVQSARMFYTGGRGGQPGLLDIAGFESMNLTEAAQAVQRSAFPSAYAKWEALAVQVVGEPSVLSSACYSAASAMDGTAGGEAVRAAIRWLGTPYSWGGGTINGPGEGFGRGAGIVGFDCSSLTQYAWHQAGARIPRVASAQAAALPSVGLDPAAWRAGDLVFFHAPGDPATFFHHVGMYDGQGGMIHTPRTGLTVEVVHDFLSQPYWRNELAYVGRPAASQEPPVVAGAHHD